MSDPYERRRRVTSIMVASLAVLTPLLTAAVVWLVVSDLHGRARDRQAAHDVIQQSVRARYDDCLAGEQVRRALREQVQDAARTDPLLYRLLPQLDTPQVRRIVRERRARQLRAFAPKGCREFALAAVPPSDRDEYTVP